LRAIKVVTVCEGAKPYEDYCWGLSLIFQQLLVLDATSAIARHNGHAVMLLGV